LPHVTLSRGEDHAGRVMADQRASATQQETQDAEALARLGALASGPSIVEGGKGKPGLIASAVSALSSFAYAVGKGAAYGLVATAAMVGVVSGAAKLETAYNKAVHAVAPLGEGTYGGIVARLQAEVGSDVLIYDRSAPKEWENKRVAAHLGMRTRSAAALPDFRDGGAYATVGILDEACFVMGPTPQDTARVRFDRYQQGEAKLGDVDDETAALDIISHEVGHCIVLGKGKLSNEGQADAFAALMVMKSGKSKDHLPLLLVSRELDEYTVKGDDSHYTSNSLRWVLEKSSDPAFVERVKAASMEELVQIAKEAPSLDSAPQRIARIRDAVAELGGAVDSPFDSNPVFVVPVKEGFVMTNRWEWLRANSEVPEFRRMVELSDYLSADPATRVVPDAFESDPEASARAILAVARRGDPKAARLLDAFWATAPQMDGPTAPPVHRASEVKGELVAFDREKATVSFDKGGRYFLIKDKASGKALQSGIVGQGITREHGPQQDMDALYDPVPMAARR